MKIDIPFEIGDPVLVIEYNQHDGYYINCRPFRWNDIPNINTNIFKTRKKLKRLLQRGVIHNEVSIQTYNNYY